MKFLFSFLLRLCLRLSLGLLLLVGLGIVVAGGSLHAHAAPAATLTVTDCSGQTGTGRIGTVISSASAGDTINFSCSGTIPISSALTISTNNLTLDGSGQSVTLDGGGSVQVLVVNSGVSFTLNALTVAHGHVRNVGGNGGGLNNNHGTVSISNSTFTNNSAPSDGGGLINFGTMSISNSTLANNSSGNCSGGGVSDLGYNLESGTDCRFTGAGSLQNTDPKLISLASNGGPTQTMALVDSSPAIDRIPTASCPATDQRGVTRPDNGETTCDMGAYEFVDPVDNDLGLSGLPANMTVDATSPQGAMVTYTPPTATDESGDNPGPTVSCDQASGSTFPIGATKVTCTATDSYDVNSPVSQSFTVTVKDVTPPALSLPDTITVDATSPQGATVNYTVTATDPDNAASDLTISCSPASGSTFAIGTTTVNCSASDPAGNKAAGSFQVVVKGAAAQVSDLVTTVNGDHLSSSLQNALDNKLQDVQTAITAGQTTTACSDLTDFNGYVQSHTGKGITTSQASTLIAAAKQIQAVLGC